MIILLHFQSIDKETNNVLTVTIEKTINRIPVLTILVFLSKDSVLSLQILSTTFLHLLKVDAVIKTFYQNLLFLNKNILYKVDI